ncbi:hypothetical protein OROHE_017184 [Orobanche hederae]
MAVSKVGALLVAVVMVTIFALIRSSSAQEAPSPAPASSAGVASPYSVVGFAVAFVAFVFGSAVRI